MHWAIRSSQWMLALQALRMVLGFTLGAWMARALGPQQYGIWGTAAAWGGIASCLAELGLRQLVLRLVGQRPRLLTVIAGTAFRLWTVLGIFCAFSLVLVNLATGTPIPWPVLLATATPILISSFVIHHTILDATQRAYITARNSMIAALLAAVLRLSALIWLPTLTALSWSIAADVLIVSFLAIYSGRNSPIGWLPRKWNSKIAIYMLRRSFSLVMALMALVVILRLPVILLERINNSAQAGIYSAATRLSELCYFTCPMLITLFLPKLALHIRHDPTRFRQLALQINQLMTLIAYAAIFGFIIFGTWAIHFLFGPHYARSADVLKIHALACLPYFFIEWRYQLLIAMDQVRLNALLLWLGCAISLTLNFLLIPKFGVTGAAWASLITYLLSGPIICLFIPHLRWMAFTQFKALYFPLTLLISPLQTWEKISNSLHRPN